MTPFRSPAFRYLWGSSVAFAGAQGMERVLTSWLALELGAGPLMIGVMFAIRMLPSLLFGLAAGTVADRGHRPRQLQAVGAGALILMAAFGLLIGGGGGQLWQVMLFGFIAGCVQVFDTPARQALVVDTAPEGAAMRALALNALAGRIATALGALVAGALIAQIGVPLSYLAVAASYGLVALFVAAIRVPRAAHSAADRPPFREAMWGSARLIIDSSHMRVLVIAGLICEVFAFSHMSAIPLFAQDVLAAGPEGLGTLSASLTAGGAVAVALLSLLPERVGRQPLLGATFLVYGVSIIALAGTRSLATASAALVITGCCAAAFDVLQQTLIQMAVPAEQRGRAVGVWVLSLGSAPLGHLEMGALMAAGGVPLALTLNGAVTVAAAVVLLIVAPRYRWARRQAPAG
ncbi:MFS transporter [Oscillochloris sp. ZM17-4]|uniref:MFS transporter n=1 Tax=Oscillochloris sp. ZM17-4 TaxID=2866714 RepID=UPI001C72AFF8|nr:MFS transporter [Oscillochloris sp. ZM17-4]MBX0327194.1 MFS transporter [Oscillochloris sp. ZM17-4]